MQEIRVNNRFKDGNFVGETAKAHERRKKEGWFERFAPPDLPGIDIGCGIDPLNDSFLLWDKIYDCSDATFMDGVPDNIFKTVHSSHLLEHLTYPVIAVQNWWRITAPGGNLIIIVPHRDLYELKKELPSIHNPDHKSFWLPTESEPPHTFSLAAVISTATKTKNFLMRVLDTDGEYSIEAIVQKPITPIELE